MKGEVIMDDLEKYMEKQMKNPEFRKEYEETRAEKSSWMILKNIWKNR